MPVRTRKPNDVTQQSVPLLLLAVGLVTTNKSVTFVDEEAAVLSAAADPLRTFLSHFFSAGQHDPGPLYTIVMHLWLISTGANFDYLRIPSILFYMGGLFLLARAHRYVSGTPGGAAVIWLGVLWPFGFHFVRLAAGYSFSFFLVAGITLAYFKYLEEQSVGRGAVLFLFSAALLWTNYLGWAVIACLAVDQIFRVRAKEPVLNSKGLVAIGALLCVSFVPLFAFFRAQISDALGHRGPLRILVSGGFRVFSLFASESLAPWYWWLSIPAAMAGVACIVFAIWWLPNSARKFLYFGAAILVVLAVAGVLKTSDLLMVAPWILLPLGAAIEAVKPRWATMALAAALLIVGGAGWYGVYARRYYAAPRFIEPWQEIAADASSRVLNGTTVISDRPSFELYLTYFLRMPAQNGPWQFKGTLPDQVKQPQVYSPEGWLAEGRSPSGKVMLVRRGETETPGNAPIDQVAHQLDQTCGSISSRLRMRDDGYNWKQRFFPEQQEPQWRIEIREYDCDASSSKQIYRIPAQQ